MFRLVPPAGSPMRIADLLRAFARRLSGTESGFGSALRERFRDSATSVSTCFLFSSGRAAQATALQAIRQVTDSKRTTVIVPAWTCFTVAASIVRSGYHVQPVDIDPQTLDYSEQLEQTDLSSCAAIVACNLFGLPSDITRLRTLARNTRAILIDDAAQAFGLRDQSGPCGGRADLGMVSLDRGKNLSTYSGGILIVNDPKLSDAVSSLYFRLTETSLGHDVAVMAKMIAVGCLSHPRLYWLPNRLPFLGIGTTVFDPQFPLTKLGRLQEQYGAIVLPKLDEFNHIRKQHSTWLAERIIPMRKYSIPGYKQGQVPTYLRFPLLAADRASRDHTVAALRTHGIGGGLMYPDTLDSIVGLRPHLIANPQGFPGAREVSDRLFTVPTHPLLKPCDLQRIITALNESLV